jgi:hypothetical protein
LKTVLRAIYFYKINIGNDQSGKPIIFNPLSILHGIDLLPWKKNGRYWDNDGKFTFCQVDHYSDPRKLRLCDSRRTDLPQIEKNGVFNPINIPDHSGIVEQIHIVFFDDNVIGFDFNYYGPRVTKIGYYFYEKAKDLCPKTLLIEPLINKDVSQQLEKLKTIRLFQLRIKSSYADQISKADASLGDAFKAAKTVGDSEEIEIVLRPNPHSKDVLSNKVFSAIKKIIGFNSSPSDITKFVIEGSYNQESENIKLDLLNSKILSKKSIELQVDNFKTLDKEKAYSAIENAYKELEDQIKVAGTITYD